MAKKKQQGTSHIRYTNDRHIEVRNIADVCTEEMKIFGANNNLMRHIPGLADGLKPGERRILFALYNDLGSRPNKSTIKCARITGEVIGKYHPHGDSPVYDTLVKLAQDWNNTHPLITGQGNFGNAKGNKAAASRYTEAKLSPYAYKCFFEDFDLRFISTKDTYDGKGQEPEYLPSRYINSLTNNTFGIGYGVSTGLPNYNFQEAHELALKLMDDPNYEDVVLYPDSPTGAMIVDEGQFREISETGKGKFRMRGEITIDEEKNHVIIESVPFQTTANMVKEKIVELISEKKLQGVTGFTVDGMIMTLELKKEIDPVVVKHMLYTKTPMEKTFPVNFKLIDDYKDGDYSIRSLILDWLDIRLEQKRIYFNYKLATTKGRQHILETLLLILTGNNGEKTLKVIRQAESRDEIVQYLMKTFGISSLQAKNISDMRLSAFSKDAIKGYKKEAEEVEKEIKKLDKIIRSPKKIKKIIRAEIEEGIKLFGGPRKSKVITIDGEVKIRNTNHVVVFTLDGFVKKLPEDVNNIGEIKEGDYPIEIAQVNNVTELLIFDESGKISKIPVSSLPNTELNSIGEPISKYATINGRITSIIPKPTMETLEKLKVPVYFVMTTTNGLIKKTEASHYANIKNELLGMIIKDGDQLQSVKLMTGDKEILVYNNQGFGTMFSSAEIRETNRMSIGVKAMDMAPGEVLIGMDIVNAADKYLFVLTNKGTGKKCTLENFKVMDRASKPLRITNLDKGEEVILIKTVKGNEKFKAFLKNSVEEINIEDVPELTRMAKGRKLFGVRKGEVIIDIKEVKK